MKSGARSVTRAASTSPPRAAAGLLVMPLRGGRRRLAAADRSRRRVAPLATRPVDAPPPRSLARRVSVGVRVHRGWSVYELGPRGRQPDRHVVYLHGGAYVAQITRRHWSLLTGLVTGAPARATVPIYPLGRSLGAHGTVDAAAELVAAVIDRVGEGEVVLMGDSAGGGMALAVAQTLRDAGRRPRRLVLTAPWVDATMQHAAHDADARREAAEAAPALRAAADAYADGLPSHDPRISPIYGDLADLPPITVLTGTRDPLLVDSHRLRDACAEAGTDCDLIEARGMPHLYPLMDTREGRAARRHLRTAVRR